MGIIEHILTGFEITGDNPASVKGLKRCRLMQLVGSYGFKTGAEIGVAQGRFSEYMCANNPGLNLTCVDPWMVSADDKRSELIGQLVADERFTEAQEKLSKYHANIIRAKSINALDYIQDRSLDFVYIDGCHTYDGVMIDLIGWSKKVKEGGLISGHDYYEFRWSGVIPAVMDYTRAHRIRKYYLTTEREPTFFWENK